MGSALSQTSLSWKLKTWAVILDELSSSIPGVKYHKINEKDSNLPPRLEILDYTVDGRIDIGDYCIAIEVFNDGRNLSDPKDEKRMRVIAEIIFRKPTIFVWVDGKEYMKNKELSKKVLSHRVGILCKIRPLFMTSVVSVSLF